MKKLFFILILFNHTGFVTAQEHLKDSLLTLLSKSQEDTLRTNILYDLSNYYHEKSMPDSAIFWGTQALALAQKADYKKDDNDHKLNLSYDYWEIGDYTTAIKLAYPIYEYGESVHDTAAMLNAIGSFGNA